MTNEIGYVPEDRLTQGLFMEKSIQDNVIAASIRKYMKGGKLDEKEMEDTTNHWIKEIEIKAPSPKPAVRTLSGGNAQKVVIAKWLNTNPKLFILDGPTVGVDIGAKAEIHEILHGLAKKGVGIIIISDDLPELVQNCNKIVVMRDGKLSGSMDNSIDEELLEIFWSVPRKEEQKNEKETGLEISHNQYSDDSDLRYGCILYRGGNPSAGIYQSGNAD